MPVTIHELIASRPRSLGRTNRVRLKYAILGTDDDDVAYSTLAATAPEFFGGLALENLEIDDYNGARWLGIAEYAGAIPKKEGQTEYEFDTTGNTRTIYQSLETVSSVASGGGTPPDYKRGIRVTRDGPQGVEKTVPAFTFRLKHYFHPDDLTTAYQTKVADLTGCLNNAPFYGHSAGVVEFKGARGRAISGELAPVTFFFDAKPIKTSVQRADNLPAHTNVRGHDVIWEAYRDEEDLTASAVIRRPFASYVERVAELVDFSQLGIGTG